MSVEANKARALRAINEVWSQGKLEVVDELYDQSYVYHEPMAGDVHGPEGLKQLVTMFRTSYPDLTFTSEEIFGEGDKVVQRWTCTGTQKGELMGIPATNKRTSTAGINIVRCLGGKVVEEWSSWDVLGLLQQLGVVPPMGGGGE